MLTGVLTLAVAVIAFRLFFLWFEHANVFHPSRSFRTAVSDHDPRGEEVSFRADDGTALAGWFLPAAPGTSEADTVVLLHHGNGGNVGDRGELYRLLLGLGLNVFAYDYRGFGRSAGRPSESGTVLDASAAADWLIRRGFPENRILSHGESLGGAVAAALAHQRPGLRGLVLQSTFTSMPDIGSEVFPFLPVRLLATVRFDTRSRLPDIRVPVLILHSREDTLIGFHHAVANHQAAREPKWLREIRGDHNDQPEASPEAFAAAYREFLTATAIAHRTP